MWLAASFGGIVGAIAFPALAVYRNELFPTGSRSRRRRCVTAAALLGGIVGLVVMGALLDGGRSHGAVLGGLASAQLVVVAIVLLWFPETAHRELEDLNPIDRPPTSDRRDADRDPSDAELDQQRRPTRSGASCRRYSAARWRTRLRTAASSSTSRTALRRRAGDGVFLNDRTDTEVLDPCPDLRLLLGVADLHDRERRGGGRGWCRCSRRW